MPSAFHNNRRAFTGGEPYLHYAVEDVPRLSVESPGPRISRNSVQLPHGTPLVLDFFSILTGYAKFSGGFDTVMAPYRSLPVQRPSTDYKEAIQIPALVPGHGLLRWTISAAFMMNYIKLLHEQFELYPEAVEGMLAVWLYMSDDPHTMAGWPGKTFYTTGLRIEDWTLRGRDIYGPMTVRPPVPLLAEAVPPVALPANDGIPPREATANDLAPAAFRPVDTEEPTPAAQPAQQPATRSAASAPSSPGLAAANDLLAKYVRKS